MLFHRRHLIALAVLVAWYLMIPPFQYSTDEYSGDTVSVNLNAAMSKWSQVRRFEHDSDCEAARSAERSKPSGNLVDMLGEKQAQAAANAAVCVSSDDPRLKSN